LSKQNRSAGKDLYAGLIRLHVLHHADEQPVYGAWIIEELGHHGYVLGPGTINFLLGAAGGLGAEAEMEGVGGRSCATRFERVWGQSC
jgi:PadR family transcriptional regulator, regulatory protein PadR